MVILRGGRGKERRLSSTRAGNLTRTFAFYCFFCVAAVQNQRVEQEMKENGLGNPLIPVPGSGAFVKDSSTGCRGKWRERENVGLS